VTWREKSSRRDGPEELLSELQLQIAEMCDGYINMWFGPGSNY